MARKAASSRKSGSRDARGAARASPLARMLEARRREAHRKWCARHPGKAAEQRALRLAQRDAQERYGHKPYGTVETHVAAQRAREGALLRLYQSGAICIEQLGAAQEIAAEAERIGSDVQVRTVSLETRVDGGARHGDAFFEALGRVRREVAYSRWRERLPRGLAPVVLAMIVDDIGVTAAAKLHRMHPRRAKKALVDALDDWTTTIRSVVKEIDEATVLAAQAAIL